MQLCRLVLLIQGFVVPESRPRAGRRVSRSVDVDRAGLTIGIGVGHRCDLAFRFSAPTGIVSPVRLLHSDVGACIRPLRLARVRLATHSLRFEMC